MSISKETPLNDQQIFFIVDENDNIDPGFSHTPSWDCSVLQEMIKNAQMNTEPYGIRRFSNLKVKGFHLIPF